MKFKVGEGNGNNTNFIVDATDKGDAFNSGFKDDYENNLTLSMNNRNRWEILRDVKILKY